MSDKPATIAGLLPTKPATPADPANPATPILNGCIIGIHDLQSYSNVWKGIVAMSTQLLLSIQFHHFSQR
jgi:hypothetical protein